MGDLDDVEKGESVTHERRKQLSDYLDDDEEPYFILKGKTLEVQRGDETDTKSGKRVLTAITNDRILAVVFQRISGNDTRSIEYDSVGSVNLDKGFVTKKMNIEVSGKTYRFHVLDDDGEIDAAMKFVRDRKKRAENSISPNDSGSGLDPTEQLKNIKELHEQGVLTDEEFEEKKQELLQKI